MRQVKVLFLGCGFLASNFLPFIIPHASHIILIDRERIEQVNYDNHIIPKGYEGNLSSLYEISEVEIGALVPYTLSLSTSYKTILVAASI